MLVDSERGGIVSFVQEKALRNVPESAVRVSAQEAGEVAVAEVAAKLPPGVEASVAQGDLILSSRHAPDNGPVWVVAVNIARLHGGVTLRGETLFVDAINARILPVTP